MRIEIKLTDGEIYTSDEQTREKLQADLDRDWDALDEWKRSRATKPTLDKYIADGIEEAERLFKRFSSLEHISLEIDGAIVYFNPAHVIRARVIND